MAHTVKTWNQRSRLAAIVSIGVIVAAGTVVASLPASSAPSARALNTLACSSPSACISTANFGSGPAIQALSVKGNGVIGQTEAYSAGFQAHDVFAALRGVDTSVLPAGATVNYSSGLVGLSQTGFGITGFSKVHAGVVGNTSNPSLSDGYGTSGVEGFDNSTDGGQTREVFNSGVAGGTTGGTGVFGFSTLGNGVRGITFNPSSQNQQHRAGVFGIDRSTDGGLLDFGVAGFSPGTGIAGLSLSPPQQPGAPVAPAVAAVCLNGGPAIQAITGFTSTSSLLMTLDCMGNLTVSGTEISGSDSMTVTKTASGAVQAAYHGRETEPTIEDFGEAQLVNGGAVVRLNRDFASAIDHSASYMVFVTPEGDNRGLYVNHKSGDGFLVNESQGGRSTIAFSYRIVAKPYGSDGARMPLLSTIMARQRLAARRPLITMPEAFRQLRLGSPFSSVHPAQTTQR